MPWVDAYPTHELVRGAKKDGPVLVDMGGSTGHDAGKLVLKEPSTAGKVWVQDQAHVIEQSRGVLPPGVNALGHDFFTPQPVRGMFALVIPLHIHIPPSTSLHLSPSTRTQTTRTNNARNRRTRILHAQHPTRLVRPPPPPASNHHPN